MLSVHYFNSLCIQWKAENESKRILRNLWENVVKAHTHKYIKTTDYTLQKSQYNQTRNAALDLVLIFQEVVRPTGNQPVSASQLPQWLCVITFLADEHFTAPPCHLFYCMQLIRSSHMSVHSVREPGWDFLSDRTPQATLSWAELSWLGWCWISFSDN